MLSRTLQRLAAMLGMLALLWARPTLPVDAGPAAPFDLTILLSADTRGHLETCRCRHGQLGGLPRRATVFLGADSPSPRLMLDAGNVVKGTSAYDRSKMEYILAGMWAMGYDALNLGKREAALGRDALRALAAANQFPLISSNLVDAATGRLIVAPYALVSLQGSSVGVVGVADVAPTDLGAGVAVVSAEEALARVLPEVRGKSHVVVLLAAVSDERLVALAARFPAVDLVLGGDTAEPWPSPRTVGRVPVFAVGDGGSVVGRLRARWSPSEGLRLASVQPIVLTESVRDHPSLKQVVDAFKGGKDRSLQPRRARAASSAEERVAGTEACASCHAEAYRVWAGSRHAHALTSLRRRGYQKDAECLSCHTTGLGAADGYVSQPETPRLANVGCEMCHGRASLHVQWMHSGTRPPPLSASTKADLVPRFPAAARERCVACHDPEHSNFDYAAYWAKIRH